MRAGGSLMGRQQFAYDECGNLIQSSVQKDAEEWATTRYQYGEEYKAAYVTAVINENVKDADGDPRDIKTSYSYDFNTGNRMSQTDGNGNNSRFEYDKLGRLVKTILPDNSIRTLVYDDINNQLSATDANGNSLIYDYDGLGRLQNVKDSTGTILVKRAYDANGVLISEWDGNKNTQQLSYDPLYRITGVSHYDKNGNMLAQTRVAYNEAYYDRFGKPFLNVTVRKKGEGQDQTGTYYFDSFGLLAKQGRIHQGQEEMSYAWYDYLGNCVKAQDYAGNRSLFSYDGRGRLLEATDAEGQTVNFTYDLLGNQIAKSDALGQTAYFDYDSLGHNVAIKTPYQEGQYSISKGYYDPAGNLVKTVDPEGYVTNNHYNSCNLLQAVEDNRCQTVQYHQIRL